MLTPSELVDIENEAHDLVIRWQFASRGSLDQLATADLLDLVVAAERAYTTAAGVLGQWVEAARQSGASWQDVGDSLGISRQAAQQRFVGRSPATPPHVGPGARVIDVASIDSEPAVLRTLGEDGWILTQAQPRSLVFVEAGTPVEHRRLADLRTLPTDARWRERGWEVVARRYPFVYLARTTDD